MFGTLLNAAHRTYTAAIHADLVDAGFSDMPTTGYRIAVFLARGRASMQDITDRLSVSKQAASRMVDVLVRRGYCERAGDPVDRRRVGVVLTERGKAAAREIDAPPGGSRTSSPNDSTPTNSRPPGRPSARSWPCAGEGASR